MGLLDELVGSVLGGSAGNSGQMGGIMEMLSGIGSQNLQDLVQSFQNKGLGDIIGSWVGGGDNLPISAEQLEAGLGSDLISGLAEKSGFSKETICEQLSRHLPDFVNQVTPDGAVPEGNLMELAMKYLMGAFS